MNKLRFAIASLHNISSETALYIKKWFIFFLMLLITVISYYFVDRLFDSSSVEHIIDKLINVDLSLFALQIATFTFLLPALKKSVTQMDKYKIAYFKAVEEKHVEYDKDIINCMTNNLLSWKMRFQYNIFKMIILLIHLAFAIIFGVADIVAENIQLVFLFSNFICQLIYFIGFLLLLANLFYSNKNKFYHDVNPEYLYLSGKYSVNYIEKTYSDKIENIRKATRIFMEMDND